MIQPLTLVKDSLRHFDHVYAQLFQNRAFVITIALFQLLWLAVIAWTGTSTNWSKLSILALYTVLASLIAVFLPDTFLQRVCEGKRWLLRNERWLFVLLALVVLAGGVFYATQLVPWADEGRSFAAAQALAAEGVGASYRESGWLRNRHPPLVPLMYSVTVTLLGPNLFYLRVVSVLFLAGTLPLVYLLGRELYDAETGFWAACVFLSFPLVVRLGASAMMDTQLNFFFALSLLLSLYLLRGPSYKTAVSLGVAIGLGLLTKYMMVFVFGLLPGLALFKPSLRKIRKYAVLALVISLTILALWLFYTHHAGILLAQMSKIRDYSGIYQVIKDAGAGGSLYADAAATGAAPAVNAVRTRIGQLGLETLFTRLPSSLGLYHAPLMLLGVLFLARRRKTADLFVLFWIGIIVAALFLTLPDHRYFLVIFPAAAIVIARAFTRLAAGAERVLILFLLLGCGNLYLFVDWVREAHLFLPPL